MHDHAMMPDAAALGLGALFGSLFLTGLAGSLHCVGMCGPILLAFSRLLNPAGPTSFLAHHASYHAGRLWTYGLLGLLVGQAGMELREQSLILGWQRPLGVLVSALVISSGLITLGLIPGPRLNLQIGGCAQRPPGWLAGLASDPRWAARLLLGAIMGLLPCGMVYAMLLVVSTLPTPVHAAVGMVCFGAGTLPALSFVVLGSRLAPRWLAIRGPRLAAVLLVGIGVFMLSRALLVSG